MKGKVIAGKSLLIIVISATFSMVEPPSALAQPTGQNTMRLFSFWRAKADEERLDNYHQEVLNEKLIPIVKGEVSGNPSTHFSTLLLNYIKTSRYDPIGTDTIARLGELANTAITSGNEEAAGEFRELLSWHLPNHAVVRSVIPLVRENSSLGDIDLLEAMQTEAEERISPPNGKTLYRPIHVYSTGDLDYALSEFATRILASEVDLGPTGNECYHVYTIETSESQEPEKLYFAYLSASAYFVRNFEVEISEPYCPLPYTTPNVPRRDFSQFENRR